MPRGRVPTAGRAWHDRPVRIEAAVVFHADPRTVFEMLADEEYVSRKAQAMGALEHDVVVQRHSSGGARIQLQRTLPSVVPEFVRPLVGSTLEVVQTEEWAAAGSDGGRRGDLRAQIANAPVRLSGSLLLLPSDEASTIHRVDVDVRAKVPFLGGRIEHAIGEVLLMAARKEEEVGAAWLDERR